MDNDEAADVVEEHGGRDDDVYWGACQHAQGAHGDGVLDQPLCPGLIEFLQFFSALVSILD